MSRYSHDVGSALIQALSNVPSTQPAQLAGYWANRDFFLAEFRHYLAVVDGYDQRVVRMKAAHDHYLRNYGGPHNRDEFGTPRQALAATTSTSERRKMASAVRTSLKKLADRALDLKIASDEEYDAFLDRIKVE